MKDPNQRSLQRSRSRPEAVVHSQFGDSQSARHWPGSAGSGYSLHRCALGLNLTEFSDGTCGSSTAPDGKRHEQEIENNKDCDICLAADTESVAMQTLTQNKVHAIPGH